MNSFWRKTLLSATAVAAVGAWSAAPVRAGQSEWATAGKILTGVVAADILFNHVPAAIYGPPAQTVVYTAPAPVPAYVYPPAPVVVYTAPPPPPVYYYGPTYYPAPIVVGGGRYYGRPPHGPGPGYHHGGGHGGRPGPRVW